MDGSAFDDLSRVFAISRSRRRLVGLLSILPLSGWITPTRGEPVEASGRRQRRKKRHHHQQGDEKDNRTGKRKGKDRGKRACLPAPSTVTCADRCGAVTNTCDQAVDCGSCACSPACPQCRRCDLTTRQCVPLANGTVCDDGNACTQTDTCQDGICVGTNPIVCPAPAGVCGAPGTCDPVTGTCSTPNAPNGTACGTQSQPGGGGIRCCDGICPDPDCVPSLNWCASDADCAARCCGRVWELVGGGNYSCGATSEVGQVCGSDTDCPGRICQCGVCCSLSGSTPFFSDCADCCSGQCNGSVCA